MKNYKLNTLSDILLSVMNTNTINSSMNIGIMI